MAFWDSLSQRYLIKLDPVVVNEVRDQLIKSGSVRSMSSLVNSLLKDYIHSMKNKTIPILDIDTVNIPIKQLDTEFTNNFFKKKEAKDVKA